MWGPCDTENNLINGRVHHGWSDLLPCTTPNWASSPAREAYAAQGYIHTLLCDLPASPTHRSRPSQRGSSALVHLWSFTLCNAHITLILRGHSWPGSQYNNCTGQLLAGRFSSARPHPIAGCYTIRRQSLMEHPGCTASVPKRHGRRVTLTDRSSRGEREVS